MDKKKRPSMKANNCVSFLKNNTAVPVNSDPSQIK
jgi:hypothetical protein